MQKQNSRRAIAGMKDVDGRCKGLHQETERERGCCEAVDCAGSSLPYAVREILQVSGRHPSKGHWRARLAGHSIVCLHSQSELRPTSYLKARCSVLANLGKMTYTAISTTTGTPREHTKRQKGERRNASPAPKRGDSTMRDLEVDLVLPRLLSLILSATKPAALCSQRRLLSPSQPLFPPQARTSFQNAQTSVASLL